MLLSRRRALSGVGAVAYRRIAVPGMLPIEPTTIAAIVDEIDRVVNRTGIDHIGIGSDAAATSRAIPGGTSGGCRSSSGLADRPRDHPCTLRVVP